MIFRKYNFEKRKRKKKEPKENSKTIGIKIPMNYNDVDTMEEKKNVTSL